MSEKKIKREDVLTSDRKPVDHDWELEQEPSPSRRTTCGNATKVLVVYAGGTIGMAKSANGWVPRGGHLFDLVSKNPTFGRKATNRNKVSCTYNSKLKSLPTMDLKWALDDDDEFDIKYGILEYDPLFDSSNTNMEQWEKIANTVSENYDQFDGFVILHGTDTMAYTASALSYLLQNLTKCVVLTGSQKPMEQLLTDAIKNFTGALIFAGPYSKEISEVGLFFNNELFRGNRTTKHDASGFDAFSSPNLPCLAKIGVNVKLNQEIRLHRPTKQLANRPVTLRVYRKMDDSVGAFVLFPGITSLTMQSCLEKVKGAVILTYGAGNGPSDNNELMDVFKNVTQRQKKRVLLVNITQCLKGEVEAVYATGKALQDAGLILGRDMTLEAALTKLSFVLALDKSYEEKKRALEENLRGELVGPNSALGI